MNVIESSLKLRSELARLRFHAPISHVYNPLEYALEPFCRYVEMYGLNRRETLLVGMNPGFYGMVQTGVPFADSACARGWMHIEGHVGRPVREHPKRPVQGFACSRRGVSGTRVYDWAKDGFQTAENFFERFFLYNYCPLAFIEASGRGRTPDKLSAPERTPLFEACDDAVRSVVQYLHVDFAMGFGNFATERLRIALSGLPITIGKIPHPSPANPQSNRGWGALANHALRACGMSL